MIAGGSLENGTASAAVLAFRPGDRRGRPDRAAAGADDARGRGRARRHRLRDRRPRRRLDTPTARIVAVDPRTRRVRAAGTLASPRSDLAAAALGDADPARRRPRHERHRARRSASSAPSVAARHRVARGARRRDDRGATSTRYDGANMLTGAARLARPLVYVPNSQSDTVDVIDPRTYRIVEHFAVGALPQHVVPAWDLRDALRHERHRQQPDADRSADGQAGRADPGRRPLQHVLHARRPLRDRRRRAAAPARLPRRAHVRARTTRSPCRASASTTWTSPPTGATCSRAASSRGRWSRSTSRASASSRTIDLPDGRAGMPQDVKLSPDGKIFYVADMHANGVWEVDGRTATASLGFLPTGAGAHGLYPSRDAKLPLRHEPQRGHDLRDQLPQPARSSRSGGSPAAAAPTWAASRPTARCSGSPGRYNARRLRDLDPQRTAARAGSPSAAGRTASASGRSPAATRSATPACSASGAAFRWSARVDRSSEARARRRGDRRRGGQPWSRPRGSRAPRPTGLDSRVHARLAGAAHETPLEAISPTLREAVVATEDERYYRHHGVDILGVARALPYDVVHLSLAQGASTITEQVAKLLYLGGSDRTPWRKLEDAALAVKLEGRYTKEQILDAYLNSAYFGEGAYGATAASERYFGIPPRALDAAQASMLAGLIQAPSAYDPMRHPELARSRQVDVLRSLVRTGFLTDQEAVAALARPLRLRSGAGHPSGTARRPRSGPGVRVVAGGPRRRALPGRGRSAGAGTRAPTGGQRPHLDSPRALARRIPRRRRRRRPFLPIAVGGRLTAAHVAARADQPPPECDVDLYRAVAAGWPHMAAMSRPASGLEAGAVTC